MTKLRTRLAAWLRRRSRRRAVVAMYSALRPDEDSRMVTVALFYGESLDQIRARIASGHRIGHALGHTLLFPPAPPPPPAEGT